MKISLFLSVGLALKILVSWLTCFVHFLASRGRKERGDWEIEMEITSIAAVFMSWSNDCRRCSGDGLVDGTGSGQCLNFFAKRSQSAFSVIHLGGIWIPGAFWNDLVISKLLAMWSEVSL